MKKYTAITTVALLALLLFTGIGKYTRAKPIRHNLEAADVPRKWWDGLATLEMLGVIGIVVGFVFPPIGILTCICLIMYLSGAVIAHLKAGDPNVAPSGAGAILAAMLIWPFRQRMRSEPPLS